MAISFKGAWATLFANTFTGDQNVTGQVIATSNITAGAATFFAWLGRSRITSPTNGFIQVTDSASSIPNSQVYAGSLRTSQLTVAGLPAAATAGAGARSFVTDALGPTFGSAVAGSGAVAVPVYSTGSAWNVG